MAGLNEEQFVAEMNRQLREHPQYRPGMEFIASPPGSTGASTQGLGRVPEDMPPGLAAEIRERVIREFGPCEVTPHRPAAEGK